MLTFTKTFIPQLEAGWLVFEKIIILGSKDNLGVLFVVLSSFHPPTYPSIPQMRSFELSDTIHDFDNYLTEKKRNKIKEYVWIEIPLDFPLRIFMNKFSNQDLIEIVLESRTKIWDFKLFGIVESNVFC